MFDLDEDIFAQQPYGKAALQKLGPVAENFRLYSAGWLGEKPKDWDTMEIKGAEFRAAKSGPNKGKLVIEIPGTRRTVYVSRSEMAPFRTGD